MTLSRDHQADYSVRGSLTPSGERSRLGLLSGAWEAAAAVKGFGKVAGAMTACLCGVVGIATHKDRASGADGR